MEGGDAAGPVVVTARGRQVWAAVGGRRVRVVPVVRPTDAGPIAVWQLWGPWAARAAWRTAAAAAGVDVDWDDTVDLGPAGARALAAWPTLDAVAADQARREAGRLPPLRQPPQPAPPDAGPPGRWERLATPDADWRVTWPGLVSGRTVMWSGYVQHHGHRLAVRYHTPAGPVWTLQIAASGCRWLDEAGRPGRRLTTAEGWALWRVWQRAAWWGGSTVWGRWAAHLAASLQELEDVWEMDPCRDPAAGYHGLGPISGWQVHLQEAPGRPAPAAVALDTEDDGRGPGDTWAWRTPDGTEAWLTCWPSGDVWISGPVQRVWVVAETRDVWADI